MGITGVIAEFNPLHNGHEYLLRAIKNDGHTVVCVISGNFVQRGDTAIIPKSKRAKSALFAGADIVLELPIPWSMSTAQNFALGGISQLKALNIDTLCFGSECGDTNKLILVAETLLKDEFNNRLKTALKTNKTFAQIRQEILKDMIGDAADILSNPNDTLAVEYILAAKKLGLNLNFLAVKRQGAGHNDLVGSNEFASSTMIRNAVFSNDFESLKGYMPDFSFDILKDSPVSNIEKLDVAILSKLKLMKKEDFSSLPDISEGLDNLIYSSLRVSASYGELLDTVKSKRYTLARIRRIILSAFLGIDNSFFLKEPPYTRVLGFSKEGAKILPKSSTKPVVTTVAEINSLNDFAKKVFETEVKANEIYALSLDKPEKYINDYKFKILKK